MADDTMNKIYRNIEKKRVSYPKIINEVSGISSVDEHPGSKLPMSKALKWAESNLKHLGAFVTVADLGYAEFDGKRKRITPVVYAALRADVGKPTLCVYAHLDTKKDKKDLFGKGVVDSKGPLLCWFLAIQCYKSVGAELPVNVRFLIENAKDYEEDELLKYLRTSKELLFHGVKFICLSDSPVLEGKKPLITYGFRGRCGFEVTVEGGKGSVDCGQYSGAVQEVMTDMVALMSSLVTTKGEVLLNLSQDVAAVTPEEEKACHASCFSVTDYRQKTGANVLLHKENKKSLLMHRNRFSSLSIHSIDSGDLINSIPMKVTAKCTITTVPHQRRNDVKNTVINHLTKKFKDLKSNNKLNIEITSVDKYWLGDYNDKNYTAIYKAVHKVMKEEPEFVRKGSCYSAIAELQEIVEPMSVALLPVGYADATGSLCAQTDMRTFMDGVKIIVAYLDLLSKA
uniref:Peptidase M20 dimerisation domain-containing protein n=1 Tax=Clastoptera arizonana TaxID=38151 RepID=A0A1B6CQQ7_9HEMI